MSLRYMVFFHVLYLHVKVFTTSAHCDDIKCSMIFDPVCGLIRYRDGTYIFKKYHNLCTLNEFRCRLDDDMDVLKHVSDKFCRIIKTKSLSKSHRRMDDYPFKTVSTGGTHHMCNHTCPVNCLDVYDPVCILYYDEDGDKSHKPTINHCHADLVSCTFALNITLVPMFDCWESRQAPYMFQMTAVAMKTLGILPNDAQRPNVSFPTRQIIY